MEVRMKGLLLVPVLAFAFLFAGSDTANAQCRNGSCRVQSNMTATYGPSVLVRQPVRSTVRYVVRNKPVRSCVGGVCRVVRERQPVRTTVRRVVRWRPFGFFRGRSCCR